jgi:integrase/recombinase XerD
MPPRKRPVQAIVPSSATPADPSQHLSGFIQYLKAECGHSQNTILAYRLDLTRFDAWYREHGPSRLQLVDLGLLTRYLEDLHQHQYAATSMARHLVSLKMFFRYLVLEGILPESVVELVNSPKLWQHLPKVLSPEKVDELIAAPLRQDRYPLRDRALLALMYATGCRASEVCGITLRDIQLEEGYCRCVGKGNKERIVSLNPVATAAVEAYLQHERPVLVLQDECRESPSGSWSNAMRPELEQAAKSARIHFVTVLRPTCWRAVPRSVLYKNYLDTPAFGPLKSIPMLITAD